MKQKLKGGWEWDWTTSWRQVTNFNPGVGKYIKRRMNKRHRKEGKNELSDQIR